MLRDGVTGDWIGTFLGHKGAVHGCRLNNNFSLAVTAGADFTAKVWNATEGDELNSLDHKHVVKAACFSVDDRAIFTGGFEKKLRIFDVNNLSAPPQIYDAPHQIHSIVALKDPNMIMTSSPEKCIRIWDRRAATAQKLLETSSEVTGLSLSGDGTYAACAATNEVLFINTGRLEVDKTYLMPRDITCVAVHPGANRFVTGCPSEGYVRVYDWASGQEVACVKGHHGFVQTVTIDPAGLRFASGSDDAGIRIQSFATVAK